MATHSDTWFQCLCGHRGAIHMTENDQPYSANWEKYTLRGLNGAASFYKQPFAHLDEVIANLKPTCPQCGAALTAEHRIERT